MTTKSSEAKPARRNYEAPTLTTHGSFSELTASGSGFDTENNNGGGQPNRRL